MARGIWSGSIAFGLVSVPVKMYTAIAPKAVRFNQLNSKTGARVQQKRVDAGTGQEVPYEDIVKGYEIDKDRYVIVTPEELEAVAPDKTTKLTIEEFVPGEQINPLWYDASYYIGPADKDAGKVYGLLTQVMENSGKVAIGRFVMRSKEKVAVIRVDENGVMVCSTLVMPDEINKSDRQVDIDYIGVDEANDAEVAQAQMLIDALTGDFDHSRFEDTYRAQVLDLIQRKAAGEEVPLVSAEKQKDESSPDLMATLTASLEQATKKKPAAKKPATKKPTAKATAKVTAKKRAT